MQNRFETFTLLISRVNRAIQKIKSEEMAEFNLKSSHVSCLYYLYKENSLTARDLCEICGEDKANISRSIKYLETNGYLVCESTAGKRYLSALMLTEKGSEVGERIVGKIDNILNFTSMGVSPEDREIMYRSLRLIAENLDSICGGYSDNGKNEEDNE